MIHQFRYRGWLVFSECASGDNEFTNQTGLLPWGVRYTTPADYSTVSKSKGQHLQNPEEVHERKVYENIQTIHDATVESDHLIGTKEVASILNIPIRQVQRLAKRGKLPPLIPHNKNLLWIKEEFIKWLNNESNRRIFLQ